MKKKPKKTKKSVLSWTGKRLKPKTPQSVWNGSKARIGPSPHVGRGDKENPAVKQNWRKEKKGGLNKKVGKVWGGCPRAGDELWAKERAENQCWGDTLAGRSDE